MSQFVSFNNQAVICYNGSDMSSHLMPLDISNSPELLRLAEEVATTKKPRRLTRKKKTLAVLVPVEQERGDRTEQQAIEETLALAGAWGERNWDEVEAELDRVRHQSKPTPPFEL